MTTLFKAEWGSRAYGTNNDQSDHDLIQVVIEPREYITGLLDYRPKHTSTAEQGKRSTRDDTDTVTYGLKKYADLAVQGNPQVMATLWLNDFIEKHPLFDLLQDERHICVSKNAGRKYLGYMRSQRSNLEQAFSKRTNRPELIHKYGYDVKFAMHAVRLGFQGYELITRQSIELPLRTPERALCLSIRNGEMSKRECLDLIYELEGQLEDAIEKSDLPEQGDRLRMSQILHEIYTKDWNA
jgi:hypothetical protein